MSRKGGRLRRSGQEKRRSESRILHALKSPELRRRVAYVSGIATLAGIPLTCYYPLFGLSLMGGAGGVATIGAFGRKAEKPYPKVGELTRKEIRILARKCKEEEKRVQEKKA